MRTRTCAYRGVSNVSFPENFANVLNESPIIFADILLTFENKY